MKKSTRVIAVILTVLMGLTTLFSVTASANDAIPPATGKLHVHKFIISDMENSNNPTKGETTTASGIAVPNGTKPLKDIVFDVYQVIIPTEQLNITPPVGDTWFNTWAIKMPESEKYLINPDDVLINYEGAVPTQLKSKDNEGTETTFAISARVDRITTNASGEAATKDLPLGIYLVIEKEDPRVVTPAQPFLVAVPMTNPQGDGWLQDVHVYPKNEDARITKVADRTVVQLGEIVTWTVMTTIPVDVAACKQYEMWDKLDTALDYVSVGDLSAYQNLKVELLGAKKVSETSKTDFTNSGSAEFANSDGNPLTIPDESTKMTLINETPGQYYTVTVTGNKLTVSFTPAGFAKLGQKGIDEKNLYKFVRYTFQTSVNESINDTGHQVDYFAKLMGDYNKGLYTPEELATLREQYENAVTRELENQANWDYTNRFGEKKYRHSQRPKIHTGAIIIDKVDVNTGAKLGGAEFQIATSEQNAKDGKYLRRIKMQNGRWLVIDYGESKIVNGVTYSYDDVNPATSKPWVWIESTTALGYAIFEGLRDYNDNPSPLVNPPGGGKDYNDYWLVEIQAPTGYNLLNGPVKAQFSTMNSLPYDVLSKKPNPAYTIDKLIIKNSKGFEMPRTGGLGLILFTAGGVTLIGLGILLFVLGLRKKKENQSDMAF